MIDFQRIYKEDEEQDATRKKDKGKHTLFSFDKSCLIRAYKSYKKIIK